MCSIIQENLQWDLSSLRYIDKDYNYTSPQGTTFLINVCTPLRTELWHVDNPEKVAAVVRTSGGDRSIGTFEGNLTIAQTTPPSPVLFYPSGSPCPSSPDTPTTTIIHFTCANTAFDKGPVLLGTFPPGENEQDACGFVFEWDTPAACPMVDDSPNMGHLGAITLFFVLTITVVLAYVLGTVLYNRFILHQRGLAQLPALPSLPSLSNPFKRGSPATGRSWGLWGRGQGGGQYYGRLATEATERDDDEEDRLVGRFGLDSSDEDDDEDARVLPTDAQVWRSQSNHLPPPVTSTGGLVNI